MKKIILTVFGVIGILLLCLLVWDAVFNGNGLLATVWNALAGAVNGIWHSITGGSTDIMQTWVTNHAGNLHDGQGLVK